jgi:hypothetical protein
MRLHQTLFSLVAIAGSVFAQNLKPVADRLAAQNALFEEQYESDLRNFPERATAFGDYRYNDKLAEYSLDAIAQRHRTDEAFLPGWKPSRVPASPTRTSSLTISSFVSSSSASPTSTSKSTRCRSTSRMASIPASRIYRSPSPSTPSSTMRTTSPAFTRSPKP